MRSMACSPCRRKPKKPATVIAADTRAVSVPVGRVEPEIAGQAQTGADEPEGDARRHQPVIFRRSSTIKIFSKLRQSAADPSNE
jgi:hypothetical protein